MQDRTQKIIIAVLALLLVVVSGALVSQVFFSKNATPTPIAVVPAQNQNANLPPSANQNVNTPVPVAGHDLITDASSINGNLSVTAQWLTQGIDVPAKTVTAVIGRNIPTPKSISEGMTVEPEFTKVGTITAVGKDTANYVGDDLYRIRAGCDMGDGNCINNLAIADKTGKQLIILSRYAFPVAFYGMPPSVDYPLTGLAKPVSNLVITDLEAPEILPLKESGYSLTTTSRGTGSPDPANYEKGGTSVDGTIIYIMSANGLATGTWGRLPDGEYVSYDMNIPFYADKRIPAVTWNDGTINRADYSPMVSGGCGQSAMMDVQDESNFTDKLTVAGKTINGEDILALKDPNDPVLAAAYSQWNPADAAKKTSLADFAASRPIFFWHDPFGRLVEWTRTDIQPMAECGKPVIYLYPTQTEAVSVKLGNNITVEKSEPAYGNGWSVTADPNGTLTNADGKTFPYLYWDGNGASYATPMTGFVVARNNVEATLKSKLTQLGLNTKEISDFNDFWLPIVTKSPYALISFVPQAEWSKAAPLAISPAPQTVIRVFMDWKPLSAPISIAPQTLPPTPVRTGFTAVEWGGLLYK